MFAILNTSSLVFFPGYVHHLLAAICAIYARNSNYIYFAIFLMIVIHIHIELRRIDHNGF